MATIVVRTDVRVINHKPPLHNFNSVKSIDLLHVNMTCTLVSGPMDPVEYGCLDLSLRLVQPFVECDYSFGVTYTFIHGAIIHLIKAKM